MARALARLTNLIEANIALFAFLLFYPWEFLQVPFYREMIEAPHWQAIKACTMAAAADAVIVLAAHGLVAVQARARRWVLAPTRSQLLSFVGVGLAVVVVVERLALERGWWSYSDGAWVVAGLGVGLNVLLQWVVLPPLVLWFVRRQRPAAPRSQAA